MVAAKIFAAAALTGLAVAAPANVFSVPNANGFPKPNAQQTLDIETLADGKLSNSAPPPALNAASITAFQLIAYNELFESAYFSSLLYNVTNDVPGYEYSNRTELVDILTTVLAQEELHALNALNVLNHFNAFAPSPCEYTFGVDNLYDAIALAETFTGVVLGTLQDVIFTLASAAEAGPARAVSSVVGQEGEQNGFYRYLLNRKPSESPFLTTNVLAFAFTALQEFTVSCPFPLSNIDLQIFETLSITTPGELAAKDQTLSFTADLTTVPEAARYYGGNGQGLFITYLSGQLNPISEPVSNVKWNGKSITFDAFFPVEDNLMFGLSIAALTTNGTIATADDVPCYTLAAPGLIQINDDLTHSSTLAKFK